MSTTASRLVRICRSRSSSKAAGTTASTSSPSASGLDWEAAQAAMAVMPGTTVTVVAGRRSWIMASR